MDAAFCYPCNLGYKNEISVSPLEDNDFVTKGLQNWKKALYSEKDECGESEKHQHIQSNKTAVLR